MWHKARSLSGHVRQSLEPLCFACRPIWNFKALFFSACLSCKDLIGKEPSGAANYTQVRQIHNEYQAAEDLGGVIVRTVEFVSDPRQEGEGAHASSTSQPGSAAR
jgi:hypothetical protein